MQASTAGEAGLQPASSSVAPGRSPLPERFRDVRRTARRSQADCFLAIDSAGGGTVLVKLGMPLEIEAEAAVLRELDHPAIARLRASGPWEDKAWLATELVPGTDLENWLARNAVSVEQTRQLLLDLADALSALHAGGILHRDLKPANIVLRPDHVPVLVDLGAAEALGAPASTPALSSILSHGYAAPEQYGVAGKEGPWTDVYGLAALAYRMLTGETPLPAPARLRRDTLAPIQERRPDCPDDLAAAIDQGLALEPGARPQDLHAWRAFLAQSDRPSSMIDDGPPTVRVPRRPAQSLPAPAGAQGERPRPRPWPRRLLWLAVPLVLAGAAGFAGWRYWSLLHKQEWIVDPSGAGDAGTIAEAIRAAPAGARVLVRPGRYAESLSVNRPVTLSATDPANPPEIAPPSGLCLRLEGNDIGIAHLVLRGPPAAGPEPPSACVVVARGDPILDEVTILAKNAPALAVSGSAIPSIRGGRFAAEEGPAVLFTNGAQGSLAGSVLETAGGPSLLIRGGAAPEITRSELSGGGVVVAEGARPVLRDSRIEGVRGSGIEVASGAVPTITGNTVTKPAEAGIFIHDGAAGRIENNRIDDPGLSGVVVARAARAELVGNTVRDAGEHGILVVEGGGGTIEGNTVESAEGHGVVLGGGTEVQLGQNRLEGNRSPQLFDGRET